MANKRVDSLKAKQKRQKIIAAGLGVVFLGVAAFQGPKLWKQLHPPASQATPSYNERTTTTTSGTPSLAAPSLSGNQSPTSPSSSDSLASTPAPKVADGQLSSFSLFASKDPFAQQLSDNPDLSSSSSSSSGSSSGGGKSSSSHSGGSSSGGGGGGGGGGSSSSGGSASAPTPGTAVISVNGTLYSVAVGNDFPAASSTDPSIQPLFHLVSVTAHTAKVSIVGGSYANGAPSVTLQVNKPVTLMNTADGTRYKLILKPVGTPVAAPAAPTSTTSTTVTVPPPSSP
jgi:hypothetical protein